jgi:hypothetical protein
MERFYDDSEDQEPVFGDDETEFEAGPEAIALFDQHDVLDMMQIEFVQVELKQSLLEKAIQIAKQRWFWSFRSPEFQMRTIANIYKELAKLTDQSDE